MGLSEVNPPCSSIVLRAVLRRNELDEDTGLIKPTAFIQRPNETDGISVTIASSECSALQLARSFKKCYGVVSLHVGYIRDIGLDVRLSPPPESHALIVGFPANDAARTEYLAGLLANSARRQL